MSNPHDYAADNELPWIVAHRQAATQIAIIAVVASFMVLGTVLWLTGRFDLETVGYPGVWIFSFIGAASIVVPVPGLAAVCVGASDLVGLHPVAVGVLAGSAEALGEMTGYLAGVGGREIISRHRWYSRIRTWVERHGIKIIFLMGVVPNPAFDILGIAAGSMAFPVRRFLAITFVAKSIKSTGIAYACYFGVAWIDRWVSAGG